MIVILTIIRDSKIRNKYKLVWPQERTRCAPQSMHLTYNVDEGKLKVDTEYNKDVTAIGNVQTEELGFTMLFRALKITEAEDGVKRKN